MFIYLVQAEGTLDAVLAARREDKRGVQDLLMDYMKKKPHYGAFLERTRYLLVNPSPNIFK